MLSYKEMLEFCRQTMEKDQNHLNAVEETIRDVEFIKRKAQQYEKEYQTQ